MVLSVAEVSGPSNSALRKYFGKLSSLMQASDLLQYSWLLCMLSHVILPPEKPVKRVWQHTTCVSEEF